MTHIPFLFNQTIEQMRCIGARGGKAHARNWQARQRAAAAGPRETPMPATPPRETTIQAMALLDAQFPWLRGAAPAWQPAEDQADNLGPSLSLAQGRGRVAHVLLGAASVDMVSGWPAAATAIQETGAY